MGRIQNYIQDITKLTSVIEAEYAKLHIFFNENPITIPSENHPDIGLDIMKDYIDSLKQLLKHYVESLNTK